MRRVSRMRRVGLSFAAIARRIHFVAAATAYLNEGARANRIFVCRYDFVRTFRIHATSHVAHVAAFFVSVHLSESRPTFRLESHLAIIASSVGRLNCSLFVYTSFPRRPQAPSFASTSRAVRPSFASCGSTTRSPRSNTVSTSPRSRAASNSPISFRSLSVRRPIAFVLYGHMFHLVHRIIISQFNAVIRARLLCLCIKVEETFTHFPC
jgi:hypothetical protein